MASCLCQPIQRVESFAPTARPPLRCRPNEAGQGSQRRREALDSASPGHLTAGHDTDRDGSADCQLGINTDAPKPGQLRVWVKNLATGVTDERVGPPYGVPFDFADPSESATEPSAVTTHRTTPGS